MWRGKSGKTPFGTVKQEEMTDFVTDLRAKGWNVHDAQQEARQTSHWVQWMCMSWEFPHTVDGSEIRLTS